MKKGGNEEVQEKKSTDGEDKEEEDVPPPSPSTLNTPLKKTEGGLQHWTVQQRAGGNQHATSPPHRAWTLHLTVTQEHVHLRHTTESPSQR